MIRSPNSANRRSSVITRAVEVEFDTFLASNSDLAFRTAASASFATDMIRFARSRRIGPVKVQKPKAAIVARRSWRAHSLHVFDPTKWRGARRASTRSCGSLSARISAGDFQEVLTPCSARTRKPLAGSDRRLKRWKTSISVQKRDCRTPLRLRWRRRLSAGADGATSRMHAGTDWRDAEGKKELIGFQTACGERAELEGIARRFEARAVDRARVAVAMARSASGKLSTRPSFDASQRCWLHKR